MKKVILFIVITFSISWSFWGLQYLGQEGFLPEWVQAFGILGLFGPFFSFLIISKKEEGSLKERFIKLFAKFPIWIAFFALLSPMVISGLAYLIYTHFETGPIEPLGMTISSFIPTITMILFVGGPIEEFGWRGLLLPELRRRASFILVVLILGIIHAVWHLPLHYLNGTVQSAIRIYEFILITIAITVSYVFIFEYTKSLIPMILLHWSANVSSALFPYYYNVEGRYALLVFTLFLDVLLIFIYYKKNKAIKLEVNE
jgi:membrane protease YdiL (CAAX protease family)